MLYKAFSLFLADARIMVKGKIKYSSEEFLSLIGTDGNRMEPVIILTVESPQMIRNSLTVPGRYQDIESGSRYGLSLLNASALRSEKDIHLKSDAFKKSLVLP